MTLNYREIPIKADTGVRLWERSVQLDTGCVVWTGPNTGLGYGVISIDNRNYVTHRVSYVLANGPIPPGLQLDHLCKVTECLLPEHLEAVTPRVNYGRSGSPAAVSARTGACAQGHALSGDNLYIDPKTGQRVCRTCRRRYRKRWSDKNRGGPARPRPEDRTHCPHGHEYTPENTRVYNGRRFCKACPRERRARISEGSK